METYTVKKGDTFFKLRYSIEPASIDLTGATVVAGMRRKNSTLVTLTGTASIVRATGSPTLEYAWFEADTAVPGDYEFEFKVQFPDGSVQTFPKDGYLLVKIAASIAVLSDGAVVVTVWDVSGGTASIQIISVPNVTAPVVVSGSQQLVITG